MLQPDGPLDEAPDVIVADGEVLLVGERVSVAYTPAAARALLDALHSALAGLQPGSK